MKVRLGLFACVTVLGAIVASSAVAGATQRPAPEKQCTAAEEATLLSSYARDLERKGFELTAFGRALAEKRKPELTANTGQRLIATSSGEARTTQSAKRLTGSAWVPFYCLYGQQANVTFTTGVGPSFVEWYRFVDVIRGPTLNCSKGQCVWYAFHDPPSSRAVDFAWVTAFTGPTIAWHYCGGG